MSKKLYLECTAGISGDMFTAALLDLGVNVEVLLRALHSLHLDGYKVEISRVLKQGLDACDFKVRLDSKHENHDHDMQFLHSTGHDHDIEFLPAESQKHNHDHGHNHKHDHNHDHNHDHSQVHEHRGLADIIPIIKQAEMTTAAKEIAVRIFTILADAEAKAHGVPVEQVHFHEVGAVDSIVDIVAAAVCMDNLEVEEVIVPVLYEGSGFIRCLHGIIPVPVPAVAAIVQKHNLALHITETQGEFVTPTGAAIAAAIRTSDKLPQSFTIVRTGIGAGKRNYERPSILRAMLIQEKTNEQDYIYKLESNIDDCSGQMLGYVMERLMEAGARDVHYIPAYMKKNRPAYQLNVICSEDKISELEKIIFSETTTIGIRRQKMERSTLKREIRKVNTSLGEALVKVCSLESAERFYPEYESVTALSRQFDMAWQDVFQLIMRQTNG